MLVVVAVGDQSQLIERLRNQKQRILVVLETLILISEGPSQNFLLCLPSKVHWLELPLIFIGSIPKPLNLATGHFQHPVGLISLLNSVL